MKQPKSIYAQHAAHTIVAHLNKKSLDIPDEIPDELQQKAACFVTLHNVNNGSLRGCIGTLEPRHQRLYEEIQQNAISAATNDPRFQALALEELDNVEVSVDVLSEPEKIEDISQLNPKKYGVIVSHGQWNRGVLLPNIEGIENTEHQVRIVKRKAGLQNVPDNQLEMYRFTATRYY